MYPRTNRSAHLTIQDARNLTDRLFPVLALLDRSHALERQTTLEGAIFSRCNPRIKPSSRIYRQSSTCIHSCPIRAFRIKVLYESKAIKTVDMVMQAESLTSVRIPPNNCYEKISMRTYYPLLQSRHAATTKSRNTARPIRTQKPCPPERARLLRPLSQPHVAKTDREHIFSRTSHRWRKMIAGH